MFANNITSPAREYFKVSIYGLKLSLTRLTSKQPAGNLLARSWERCSPKTLPFLYIGEIWLLSVSMVPLISLWARMISKETLTSFPSFYLGHFVSRHVASARDISFDDNLSIFCVSGLCPPPGCSWNSSSCVASIQQYTTCTCRVCFPIVLQYRRYRSSTIIPRSSCMQFYGRCDKMIRIYAHSRHNPHVPERWATSIDPSDNETGMLIYR